MGWIKKGFGGLAIVVASCVNPTGLIGPETVQFTPPNFYRSLWEDVEGCCGRKRNFKEIEWYMVPDSSFFYCEWTENGERKSSESCVGVYHNGKKITLGEKQISNVGIVSHEMLHAHGFKHWDEVFTRCVGKNTFDLIGEYFDSDSISVDYLKGTRENMIRVGR